ncbi:hypothetical protein, partial [Arthrobacter sp. SAFR-014]|uniref:hypothetical protein n=1 Tax=Arthrobacter sp. SAFR-014 TaxID=3387280 RepID=UPI003F7B9FDB
PGSNPHQNSTPTENPAATTTSTHDPTGNERAERVVPLPDGVEGLLNEDYLSLVTLSTFQRGSD